MKTEFSQDVVTLSNLKINTGKIVKHVSSSHQLVHITRRGKCVAIVQGLDEYEAQVEERAFMKAIAQGLMEVEEGKVHNLSDAKKRLGIKS